MAAMPVLQNTRWELFAQARALQGLSSKDAYLAIGGTKHPSRNGGKLSIRPQVKERIRELTLELKEKQLTRVLYSKDTVIKGILEDIESAKEDLVVQGGKIVYHRDPATNELVFDDDGEPIPVHRPDHRSIQSGWEKLGHELGMFVKEVRDRSDERDPFENMTIQELLTSMAVAVSEASDGRIQLDTDDLLGQLSAKSPGADGPRAVDAQTQSGRALQAAPEADGLPLDGADEA